MRYDAAVIGSGVAGLTSAILLAKAGRKVIVLEQARVPGGLLQVYRRGGLVFPTGVHRLGCLDPGQILWRYFQYMGLLDRLHLTRMDGDGFEEYRFPGASFRIPIGHDALRHRLAEYFPREGAAIDRFLSDMNQAVSRFSLYNLDSPPEGLAGWLDTESLEVYLDRLTACPQFKAVLAACNPLYGIPPARCPTYLHFLIFDSFLRSAWRVDENHLPLADAFVQALRAHGGEVRCEAGVAGIECTQGAVSGIRLADGERIAADTVIFTGHPKRLAAMCPAGSLRRVFQDRIASLPDSPSAMGLAIAWERPPCPLGRRDLYLFDSWATDAHYHQKLLASDLSLHLIYCSAMPSPGRTGQAVTLLCLAPVEEWRNWQATRTGARGDGYAAAKAAIAERIMAAVASQWPEAQSMKVLDTYTPLTVRDYTLSPDGSAYGISKSVEAGRSAMLSTRTRIKGLLLAGQSIILPGVLGSLISAVNACRAVPGMEDLVERIGKETS